MRPTPPESRWRVPGRGGPSGLRGARKRQPVPRLRDGVARTRASWRRLPDQAAIGCARIVREEEEGGGGKEGGGGGGGGGKEGGGGHFNTIIRESKVWASGLTPPFGHLLWAARSAVACPGCPWDGAAWHGGCALLPRWWSTPAAPSCRGSRFDSSCRGRGRGDAPPAAGIRPRAESPRRQPADAVAADAATPPPTPPPPTTTTTSTPSPPRPSPSPPPPAVENRHCRRRRRRRQRSHYPRRRHRHRRRSRRRRRRRRRGRHRPCRRSLRRAP